MARRQQEDPKAEMTPMIDVVFQLMIFFIVTIKQEDIFSRLNASAPSAQTDKSQVVEEKEKPIDIQIGKIPTGRPEGVSFNGIFVTFDVLDQYMKEQAALSTETSVLLKCTLDSPHGYLVRVLDCCHKYKMNNLSVLSQ